MANTWYEKIKRIYAENGFVYILTTAGDTMITADEAISRALAVNLMVAESYYKELANQMMQAAWDAKQQIEKMSKDDQGSFDYIKEENLNILLKYGQHRRL